MMVTAVVEAFRKLDPRTLWREPVTFGVEIVSPVTTIPVIRDAFAGGILFSAPITFWLWFTVVVANVTEAVAEGRDKAQADNLRPMRTQTKAKRLTSANGKHCESVWAPTSSRATWFWWRPASLSPVTGGHRGRRLGV